MNAIALDTLQMAKRLQSAGFSAAQSETVATLVNEATDADRRELVTKKDLQIELAPMRADMALLKWMVSFNLVLTVAVIAKLFIPV